MVLVNDNFEVCMDPEMLGGFTANIKLSLFIALIFDRALPVCVDELETP